MKAMKFWNVTIPVLAGLTIIVPPVALYIPEAIKIVPFEVQYELPEGVSINNTHAKVKHTFETTINVDVELNLVGVQIVCGGRVMGPDCYFLDYQTGKLTVDGKYVISPDMEIRVMVRERTVYNPLYLSALENNTYIYLTSWADDEVWYPNVEISKTPDDPTSWKEVDLWDDGIRLNRGETVYFRGNNPDGWSWDIEREDWNGTRFDIDGLVKVGGNVMSLIKPDLSVTTIPSEGCFHCLFAYSGVADASELILPESTTKRCYSEMFDDNWTLKVGPQLPATQLSKCCYSCMFRYCDRLIKAPILPATTLAEQCYGGMFYDCESLDDISIAYTGDFGDYYFDDLSSGGDWGWVDSVADEGTFHYSGSDTTRGSCAIPNNWEVVPYIG